MADRVRCVHCRAPITTIRYALGDEVMHFDPAASFPTEHKGTAWRYCRLQMATYPSGATS